MAHVRQQARDQAITALTGATNAGAKVYKSSRTDPFQKGFGSAIRVSTPDEESGVTGMGRPAELSREVTLRVAIWGEGGDELDDTLDTIAAQAEVAIFNSGNLGGLAKEVTLTSSGPVMDGEGAKLAGTLALDFRVLLATRENDPETAI